MEFKTFLNGPKYMGTRGEKTFRWIATLLKTGVWARFVFFFD